MERGKILMSQRQLQRWQVMGEKQGKMSLKLLLFDEAFVALIGAG
jgi:hypothetical protein